MSLRGFSGKPVYNPRGMWSSTAEKRIGNPSRASFMQNMRQAPGIVKCRPGTSIVLPTAGAVTGMLNWIAPDGTNWLLYQDGTDIKAYDQDTAATTILLSGLTTTQAPSFAPLDVWTYFCGFNTGGGTFQARIFDSVNVDKAFRPKPFINAWTAVDGGPGQCTKGQHFFGFVYQNRTGYSGIPVTGIDYAITATTNVSFSVSGTNNGTPDVVSVPGHTFVNGQTVVGRGATGDTAINGVFKVTSAIAGVSVRLTDLLGNPINGNGAYAGGGSLTAPDLITAPGNNVQVGQTVQITGATGDTAINGTQIIATVPTPGSTFTLTDGAGNPVLSNGTYTGGGTVTNPIQVTLAAGLRQVHISVTLPAMPDGGADANGKVQATLFLIGTTDANPNLFYFLPTDAQTGEVGEQPVPFNTPTTLNFVMSISDEQMNIQLQGDTAEDNFDFLAQDANGNGPFNPNFVVAYGQRMCYGTGTVLYVSDIGNSQQIAADRNQVIMPNQRNISYAFQLPGNQSLFLTGEGWTGYVTDNSDFPSTWAEPLITSDMLGAVFPNLVCARTGGPYAWVVAPSGPYQFSGSYAEKPLTYLSADQWERVNWFEAIKIQIVDDVPNLKLYVLVPLDNASTPTHIFCIDYQNGLNFDQVDISLDVLGMPNWSSIAVVREHTGGKTNLWIGPSGIGFIVHLDETTHNDVAWG